MSKTTVERRNNKIEIHIANTYIIHVVTENIAADLVYALAKVLGNVIIDIGVLRKLEWIQDEFTGATGGVCRICGGYKKGGLFLRPGEFEGHSRDCAIGNALKIPETDAHTAWLNEHPEYWLCGQ